MKSIKSRLLLSMIAALMSVCFCVGLAACGEEAFSAPENVKVTGNTLSWDAVPEAEGYTVRINRDETASVSSNSLDLKTVTAKLKEGDNSLAVKVNATEGKAESVYSEEVIYVYSPSVNPPAPAKWATPENLAINNGILSWTAVTGAQAYIVTCGTQSKEVNTASVNLAQFDLEEGATVTFTVKVKASGDKLESEAAVSPEYVVPNPTAVIEAAKLAIQAAKDALTTDDEEIVAAVNEFSATYEAYPDYVREDADVKAAYSELTAARETAQNNIKSVVDALKVKVSALNGTIASENVTEEYYNLLSGYKTEIGELGAYAKTLWTEDLTRRLDNEISVLLATPDEAKTVKGQSAVICNHQNQNPDAYTYVYVMREYKNVLGKAITGTEALPAITVSGNAQAAAPEKANASGVFVWKIRFATPEENAVAAVSYKIGDEEEVSLSVEIKRSCNIYGVSVSGGKLEFASGIAGSNYMDVYASADVTKTAPDGEVDIIIGGMPLASRVPVTANMSEDSLKSLLAREGIRGEKTLTLVLYAMTEESGKIVYSNITSAAITNYTCKLTDDDVKMRLNFTGTALEINDGGITFGGGGLSASFLNGIVAQFTSSVQNSEVTVANLKDYIRYYIDAELNGVTERIYLQTNLEVGANPGVDAGYSHVNVKLIKSELYKAFGNVEEGAFTLNIGFTLSEEAEAVYGDYLRESLPVTFEKTYSVGNVKLVNTWTLDEQDGNNADCLGFKWEVINNNAPYCNEAEVLIYRAVEGNDYSNVQPLATYVKNGAGFIGWRDVDAELYKAWGALSDKKNTEKFVFAVRALVNDDGLTAGFVNSDLVFMLKNGEILQKEYTKDWTIPTDAQIFFKEQGSGVVCVAQVKPGSSGKLTSNGEAFTSGGTDYVEVKFAKAGETDIIVYLFNEDGALKLYKTLDDAENKTGAQSCAAVNDGWANVDDINAWMGGGFDLKEWAISTRIIANDSGFYTGYPDGSDGWSVAETWDNRANKPA